MAAGLLLDARPDWVYTGQHRDRYGEVANYGEPRTRTQPDQLTQAVTAGLCVALAGVLIVLAIV